MTTDFTALLYLALLITCAGIVFHWAKRIARALRRANSLRPYNPPDQLFIDRNGQWSGKPGSQALAWWRTFLSEI